MAKSKVTTKVPRGPKDRNGWPLTFGEMVITGNKGYLDLFGMPIKPIRIYLEFSDEPERPADIEQEVDELDP